MKERMRAITIWPEWAWAIMHLGKDVENRTWQPPRIINGDRVALHAGKGVGGRIDPTSPRAIDHYAFVQNMAWKAGISSEHISTNIDGIAKIIGIDWFKKGEKIATMMFDEVLLGVVFATTYIKSCNMYMDSTGDKRSPWAVSGCYPWGLDQIMFLEKPVKCRGRQSVWPLPPEVESMIIDPYVMEK